MAKTALTKTQGTVLLAAARNVKLTAWPFPRQLRLNKGSATIVIRGLIKKGLVEERPALGDDPIWREGEDGKPLALVISKAGLAAVDMLPDEKPTRKRGSASAGNPELNTAPTDNSADAANPDQRRTPRAGSKLAMLVELLSREEGATVEEMSAATGWAQHTARGVLSGVLKKRFGLQIGSQKIVARGRVYRVEGGSARGSDEVGSTGQ